MQTNSSHYCLTQICFYWSLHSGGARNGLGAKPPNPHVELPSGSSTWKFSQWKCEVLHVKFSTWKFSQYYHCENSDDTVLTVSSLISTVPY